MLEFILVAMFQAIAGAPAPAPTQELPAASGDAQTVEASPAETTTEAMTPPAQQSETNTATQESSEQAEQRRERVCRDRSSSGSRLRPRRECRD